GAADLAAFSDSGMIADYASSHVAAMVAEGLIKGNADGTINPLGNTTRAEAAVIMQRILAK
ncbi:MAG: S-layer homology domain-containing protein, partial [Clostridia bacterium]|nr:S-layer homology domain-containing protein [Clostridia bacterium]